MGKGKEYEARICGTGMRTTAKMPKRNSVAETHPILDDTHSNTEGRRVPPCKCIVSCARHEATRASMGPFRSGKGKKHPSFGSTWGGSALPSMKCMKL